MILVVSNYSGYKVDEVVLTTNGSYIIIVYIKEIFVVSK